MKSRGGAKCIDITYIGREHGRFKCGKSFTNENGLRIHGMNNHNYCLEHRMWYKCKPVCNNVGILNIFKYSNANGPTCWPYLEPMGVTQKILIWKRRLRNNV